MAIAFESMEQRQLMSVSLKTNLPPFIIPEIERPATHANLTHGVLKVQGTANADKIIVDQTSGQLTVNVNGHKQSFEASAVKSIRVQAGSGSDDVQISSWVERPAAVYGGNGKDHIVVGAQLPRHGLFPAIWVARATHTVYGGEGHDTIQCKEARMNAFGQDGNDTIDGGSLGARLDGGAGNDRITGSWGDDVITGGDGDDVITTVDGADRVRGGRGVDTVDGKQTLDIGDFAFDDIIAM
jgi:Ca2+-binding RTX toxin-like protein